MPETILICGIMASSKSSLAQEFIEKGYIHLNRDKEGGSTKDLVPKMEKALEAGHSVVLDNTHPSVESRALFINCAKKYNVPIRCLWINCSVEDAQFNAVKRMIERKGRILSPEELKHEKDPNLFPIGVLFGFAKKWQQPSIEEGFASVEEVKFVRKHPNYQGKALILDYDSTLRVTKSGENYPRSVNDIMILPGRKEKLQEYKDKGYILLGVSNQSGIAKGLLTEQQARECFDKTNELLGHDIDYAFCPHQSGVIVCYERKPICGHGVHFIEKYKLNASECLMIGDLQTDATFAKRCGFQYMDQAEFFTRS